MTISWSADWVPPHRRQGVEQCVRLLEAQIRTDDRGEALSRQKEHGRGANPDTTGESGDNRSARDGNQPGVPSAGCLSIRGWMVGEHRPDHVATDQLATIESDDEPCEIGGRRQIVAGTGGKALVDGIGAKGNIDGRLSADDRPSTDPPSCACSLRFEPCSRRRDAG